MTTRTFEATVRDAIARLDANPFHVGGREVLESAAESGPEVYARDARAALARARRARDQGSEPPERDAGDWPADMAR